MMKALLVLEREIWEIFRDDDNHDHAAAAALHNSHKNTRTKHTQQTLFFSTRAKTLAFSMRRWDDGENIPPRSHASVSLSLKCRVFFPSIKQTTEKIHLSLSVIETRHIYSRTERRKEEDTGICVALQNACVVVLVARTFLYYLTTFWERERRRKRETF